MLAADNWRLGIELWDPAGGRRLHTLKGHKDIVWSIAFSADGKTLVSGGDDKTIRFWDVATGKEVRQIKHSQGIGKIALSPNGKFLASIDTIRHFNKEFGTGGLSYDNHVRIWDTATGKELRQLAMPTKRNERLPTMVDGFIRLLFAPDGKTLLTGGQDGFLRIWDAATGRELRQFPGFAMSPSLFVFSPDKKRLAVVDGLCSIRLLDLESGKDLVSPTGHRGRVFSMSVTPDGRAIATIGQDNTLRLWEPATGRELSRRTAPVDYSRAVGLRADGRTYLTVGADNVYRLHDLASGEERAVLRGHKSPFLFALSPDGKVLASAKADEEVRLLDPATGAVRHSLGKVKPFVSELTFSADGRTLVVRHGDHIVTIWDVATGKKRRQFPTPAENGSPLPNGTYRAYTSALSPDSKLLAIGLQVSDFKAKLGFVPILDMNTGKEVRRFQELEDGGEFLSFSPDGRMLAWSGWRDDDIHLGEIATGRVRRVFRGHRGVVQSLAFSADGKMLISGSNDTTALVWDLTGRLAMGKKYGAPLSAQQLETHWKALAGEDAAAAYGAMQALAADPLRSIPYLRKRLHPVAAVEERRLQQWIADLDSDQFAVREKAASELGKVGESALHAMRKRLAEHPSLEMRRRLEQLIEKHKREQWAPSADGLRSRRALEVLERVGTAEAKEVLTILANGAPGAWQTLDAKTALERLAQRRAR